MTEDNQSPLVVRRIVAMEALRNQIHNLEQTIADLLELDKSLPEGELRNNLFDKIGSLDSIADVMRQALDSFTSK